MSKKSKKKVKGQKLGRGELKHELQRYLSNNPEGFLSARQLIKRMKIANNKNAVTKALVELIKEKKVVQQSDKYRWKEGGSQDRSQNRSQSRRSGSAKTYEGVVDMTRSGDAFIICDGLEKDVFVRGKDLLGAMNGDRVEVGVTGRFKGRMSGEVQKVLKRTTDQFIGTYYSFKNHGVVIPDHHKVGFDVFVKKGNELKAQHEDKVVVKVTVWETEGNKGPEGEITHVLGSPGSSEIEMQSILLMSGFNVRFPEEVEAEADELPGSLSEKDFEGRRDFRNVTTFTIDPATAKDFDDALSIEKDVDGTVEIGVHIADVTHFVRPGTEIDKEAYRRSTSVYLVDRVAPMLPEKLSNELCSLRPNEDSLCFSAVFKFDPKGNILHRWFGRTIIHSDHRFAYEEAQEVIENGEGPYWEEIRELNKLAHVLRDKKLQNGALTFETDEVQFVLDDNGVPLEIYVKERKEAHMLIEDFMLLANKEVARYIGEKRAMDHIPFVYRIHDHPDPEKIAELASFARMLGFEMRIDTPRQVAKSFNALAEAARDNETLQILEPLAIRSMAKAEYNIDNIGHYGLAFTFYTHFTSPIRRYSDVLVHRILFENLDGKMNRWNASELSEQCKHISDMERRAQKAERDSIKYKQAEYMKQFVGQEFDGHISGMIERGIFVKIDATHAEGLIGFNHLPEPFSLDQNGMTATGLHSGDILKMGDSVRVRILDAIPEKRQIEMELASLRVEELKS